MDNKPKIENGIQLYFHCKGCLDNGRKDKIAVGWTVKGVQVWCETCDTSIVALDFMRQKVGYDINPKEKNEILYKKLFDFDDLSVRALNGLKNIKVSTVRELMEWSEGDLMKHRFIGKKTTKELKELLEKHNLNLKK